MSKRGFFAFLIISLTISLAVFLIIFFLLNPYEAGWQIILLFYIDLIILITSIASLIIGFFKFSFLEGKTNQLPYSAALRQGFLVAIAVVGLLLLKAGRILNFWDGLLLITAVILIEFYYKK